MAMPKDYVKLFESVDNLFRNLGIDTSDVADYDTDARALHAGY